MKKLLGIVLLGLLFASCNQNRNDIYICNPITKGNHSDQTLEIYKDIVKTKAVDGSEYTYDILEEKSDRIRFGYKFQEENNYVQANNVFYKKTKKFKWDSSNKKTENTFSIVYDCQKLN